MSRFIVIFGAYKSGTTALFYKILHSLPAPPHTLFEAAGYDPRPDDARTGVLAKIILGQAGGRPLADYDSFAAFPHQLLLVRDPRDWLVSGTLFLPQQHPEIYRDPARRAALLDLLRRKERDPDTVSFTELFTAVTGALAGASPAAVRAWITEHLDGLIAFDQARPGLHRVPYEDLVAGRLAALEKFLDLPLRGSAEVDPVHAHVPRTRGAGDWMNWFLPADAPSWAPLLDRYLRHYSYDPDWTPRGPRHVDPAHGSDYVERVMARRLAAEGGATP